MDSGRHGQDTGRNMPYLSKWIDGQYRDIYGPESLKKCTEKLAENQIHDPKGSYVISSKPTKAKKDDRPELP